MRSGERTASRTLSSDRPHASDLLPALAQLLSELGAAPASIGAVFVGTGPGSYTGLRVGIATALGLVRGSGARLLGVPSGESLAFECLAPGATLAVVLDARQSEFYVAAYRRLDSEVEAIVPPTVLTPERVATCIPAGAQVFADSSAERVLRLADARGEPPVLDRAPSAAALLALGSLRLARGLEHRPGEVEPLYLRPFASGNQRKR